MKKILSVKTLIVLLFAVAAAGSVYAGGWDNRAAERVAKKSPLVAGRHLSRMSAKGGAEHGEALPVSAFAETVGENIVISENFDKFAAGSEDAPDMSNIFENEGIIMRDYVQTYGWSGINVFQAGGCCYLSDGTRALLMTPVLDLSENNGTFTVRVSFRAESGTTNFYIAWGGASGIIGRRYAVTDTRWGTVEVECSGGEGQTMVQFYGDAPVFIDDVEISQDGGAAVEPTISVPSAMAATDITETGFTANWSEVEGATAYLLDVFCFENNEPQYFFENEEVAGTSYAVTGLDSSKLYYYTVQATDGTLTSEESSMVVVKEASASIGTPVALEVTEVTANGFRANWTSVDDAAYYALSTASYYTVPESGEFVMEDEDFSGITEGTVDNPVYNDMQCLLDGYTQYPNWEALTTIMVEGMVGLKNYAMIMGAYSTLYTPVYAVTGNTADGKIRLEVTVHKDAYCSSATEFGVCIVDNAAGSQSDWQLRRFTSDTETFEFTFDSCDDYYIAMSFGDENNSDYGSTGTVYVDDVRITQDISAGSVVTRLYRNDVAYNNTCYVPTAGKRDGERFSYAVMAVTNGEEEMLYSEMSNEMFVDGQGAVADVEPADGVYVYGTDGGMVVRSADGCRADVYDLAGRFVAGFDVAAGESRFGLAAGIYFVKVGDSVRKVVVR